jgi:uncharacterized membrane protein SirB2
MYSEVKHVHQATVVLSLCLFVLRLFWVAIDSAKLRRGWVRVLPHIIDTVLLVSAISLVIMSGMYPWQHSWLLAKVLALVAYILLGSIAIKPGRNPGIRLLSGVAALLVFGYIVSVAQAHSAWPFA